MIDLSQAKHPNENYDKDQKLRNLVMSQQNQIKQKSEHDGIRNPYILIKKKFFSEEESQASVLC